MTANGRYRIDKDLDANGACNFIGFGLLGNGI
jgi:hypothetical protein